MKKGMMNIKNILKKNSIEKTFNQPIKHTTIYASNFTDFLLKQDKIRNPPWITKKTLDIIDETKKLDSELIDFYNYVIPNDKEKKIIQTVFDLISSDIRSFLNDSYLSVELFGSNATGLSLTNSDIDICVNDNTIKNKEEELNSLNILFQMIKCSNDFNDNEFIQNAIVPIIKTKYTYQNYKYDIDISFSHKEGVESVESIKKVLNEYTSIKYVFIFIKYLLKQLKFDKTLTGGMNSLMLLNSIYGYILYSQSNKNVSPSKLLKGFLDFMTSTDFSKKGISFKNDKILIKNNNQNSFYLEDFFDKNKTNIGAKCYNYKDILSYFDVVKTKIAQKDFNSYIFKYIDFTELSSIRKNDTNNI